MPIESLSDLLPVFGRMHPLLLHLPIGLLVGLALLECVAGIRKHAAAPIFLVFIASATAIFSAASGWVLHQEASYAGGDLLETHEALGIATACCAVVVFVLRAFGAIAMYRIALLLTIGVLVPTGHFGAEMTHGKGFLFEPLEEQAEPVEQVPTQAPDQDPDAPILASYEAHVQPFFNRKCVACHGPRKVKGELRMDTIEHLLAGGESGPAIESGVAPEDQELLFRMLLPLDDDDHMPPDHKAQPSEAELGLVRAWLAAGAPVDTEFAIGEGASLPDPEANEADAAQTSADPDEPEGPSPAPEAVLTTLRDRLVHVQPIEAGSVELWIDFAAASAATDDASVRELLTPLVNHVSELSLARTQISDASLELIAAMPALSRLDLRETAVTDAGLAQLAEHPHISELVLSRTKLSDAALTSLQELPALTQLWIWEAGFSEDGLLALREALPEVRIDTGDLQGAVALETEGEIVFTSDAPDYDADPNAEAGEGSVVSLTPINSVCPVSGSSVDPRYSVVFDGRVIGFCCPNCPKTFWDDPQAFLAKLDAGASGGE
jgi:YHS domain-containing protein/mono/diheme cytochrome c family protein